MKTILIVTLVLVVAQANCQSINNNEDELSIRNALQNWVTNFNSGEIAKTFDIWAEDLIGWYPGGPEVSYQASTQLPPEGGPKSTFQLTINEIIIEGNLAVVRDTWDQTVTKRGSPELKLKLKSYEVWKKREGKWKIIRWISYVEK
jgi:ketosteroid isomerase-like protein